MPLRRSQLPQLPWYKRLWDDSQTKFLAYSQAVGGTVLMSASELHSAVTNPDISNVLDKLTLPTWFPLVLLVLAGLTYVAHGHGDAA